MFFQEAFESFKNYITRKLMFTSVKCDSYDLEKISKIRNCICRSFIVKGKQGLLLSRNLETNNVVIYCHGNNGNIFTRLEKNPNIDLMLSLGDVLIYDPRGWGMSNDILPDMETLYEDFKDIMNFAKYIDKNFILFGESLGSIPVIRYCAEVEPHNFIIQSGIIDFEEIVMKNYPFLGKWSSIKTKLYEEYEIISYKVKGVILHNPDDDIIPYSQAEKISSYGFKLYDIAGSHSIGVIPVNIFEEIKDSFSDII